MIISVCKAQETDKNEERASNRLKTPFFEQQARNKEKIVIITIQGTIINEEQEIPNSSVFLNILKKETDLKFVYIDVIEAKKMKSIRKLFRTFCFPKGQILLKNKHMDDYQHISYTLKKLIDNYDVQLMITSNENMVFYSRKLMIPMIYLLKNAEWNHQKRRRIVEILQNPLSFTF